MCQLMAERPGFTLAGMAPALAEALMQPLAPYAVEAELYPPPTLLTITVYPDLTTPRLVASTFLADADVLRFIVP